MWSRRHAPPRNGATAAFDTSSRYCSKAVSGTTSCERSLISSRREQICAAESSTSPMNTRVSSWHARSGRAAQEAAESIELGFQCVKFYDSARYR
jgi:hypothetical protein